MKFAKEIFSRFDWKTLTWKPERTILHAMNDKTVVFLKSLTRAERFELIQDFDSGEISDLVKLLNAEERDSEYDDESL